MGKAEALFLQVGATTDAAKAAIAQAMAHIEQGQWESARVHLKEALEILSDVPHSLDRARALNQLARIERLVGQPAQAQS